MSSGQGWFESDEDYRSRVAREADEQTIEELTGSAPSQGWFESDDSYRERIAQEANESRIEEFTGSAPSQGWFESDDSYQSRIAQEANEHAVEKVTGTAPSQGWFESNENYDVRIRKEANESILASSTDSSPKQGWFEGDHDYRSRIAHEAREVRARGRSDSSLSSDSSSSSADESGYSYASSDPPADSAPKSGSSAQVFFALFILVGIVIGGYFYLLPSKKPQAEFIEQELSSNNRASSAIPNNLTRIVVTLDSKRAKDIWTTSVYSYAPGRVGPGGGLDNEILRVGGWGDSYYSLIWIDLEGLPHKVSSARLRLFAVPHEGAEGATPILVDRVTESWDWKAKGTDSDHSRLWWQDRPSSEQLGTSVFPPPSLNEWYSIDITELYNAWQHGDFPNYGLQLRPVNTNNQWSTFVSSDEESNASRRPQLVIEFEQGG